MYKMGEGVHIKHDRLNTEEEDTGGFLAQNVRKQIESVKLSLHEAGKSSDI